MNTLNLNLSPSIIWTCVIIFVVFIAFYLFSSRRKPIYYVKESRGNHGNEWYGLNASGGNRGYGREYAGNFNPGYIYSHSPGQDQNHLGGGGGGRSR